LRNLGLIKITLDAQEFLSDPVGLKPTNFGHAHIAICKSDRSLSFQFLRTASPKLLLKKRKYSDTAAYRNDLNIRYTPKYFEVYLKQHHRRAFEHLFERLQEFCTGCTVDHAMVARHCYVHY